MPIERCQAGGRPGFKFGPQGKCFTYLPGDKSGMAVARNRAEAQGRAINAAGGKAKSKPKLEEIVVSRTKHGGRPAYQAGPGGNIYTYLAGDKSTEARAKRLAQIEVEDIRKAWTEDDNT